MSALTSETKTSKAAMRGDAAPSDDELQVRELQLWLRALRSFFDLRNYPLPDAYRADVLSHHWASELRIVRAVLLRSSQIVRQLIHPRVSEETIFDSADAALEEFSGSSEPKGVNPAIDDDTLGLIATTLADGHSLCESLLESKPVSLHAWTSFGDTLTAAIGKYSSNGRTPSARDRSSKMPTPLHSILGETIKPSTIETELTAIMSRIFGMLEDLGHVEKLLRRDDSLKKTLPIFTLIHENARNLVGYIKARNLETMSPPSALLETLDSTTYAISMELRKVFAHELVGVSSLRQAPAIYVKIETAHGLLSNCFRQSIISLIQHYDPKIQGSEIFDAFQTRLEQSLALRSDLWELLQLVRRTEEDSSGDLTRRLLNTLGSFYEGSLRYLMFKDWETCERFMEEIGAARDAAELEPVLHRFGAYLEALSNQVAMRAVLSDHPFDYPTLSLD